MKNILLVFFITISLQFHANIAISLYKYKNLNAVIDIKKSTFTLNEPIKVFFYIRNKARKPLQFNVLRKSYFNFRFIVYSINNKPVQEREIFISEKKILSQSSNFMNSRTSIKLSHNQVYGEVFDLKQLFNFTQPGTYVIKGMFYPIPLKYLFSENHVNFVSFQEKNKIESDYLQIEIIDEKNNNKILDVKEKIFSSNKKSNIEYSPAKIVEIILKSKMEKDWETHFSHIDLEALIQDFPNYHAIYNSTHLNYKERSKIISNFKNYLKIYFHKLGFSNFKNYTIEKTIIQNQKNRSEVHVKIEYLNKSTSFFNNYVFYLYKKNHQWLLYSYKINNFF